MPSDAQTSIPRPPSRPQPDHLRSVSGRADGNWERKIEARIDRTRCMCFVLTRSFRARVHERDGDGESYVSNSTSLVLQSANYAIRLSSALAYFGVAFGSFALPNKITWPEINTHSHSLSPYNRPNLTAPPRSPEPRALSYPYAYLI